MGGGGVNSLDSPKTEGNSDFDDAQNDVGFSNGDTSNNDKQEETIDEYTYKTYDDYFTDYNITAETITDADLTGTGTTSDPYLCHSTRGFLYLSNYELSGISLYSKYLELGCNIVLNDESFDENGTPSGGDGVVYSWQPFQTGGNSFINGKGNSIDGIYINDSTMKSTGALFGNFLVKEIKNLNISNIYFSGLYWISLFGFNITNIENCQILSGTLRGESCLAGFALVSGTVRKCNNFANIYGTICDCAGLVRHLFTSMEWCNNYGSVVVPEYGSAGLVRFYADREDVKIENCCNYGFIEGKSLVGGILSSSKTCYNVIIKNCINYGKLSCLYVYAGGIIGLAYQATISQCANFGEITRKTSSWGIGEIIGHVGGDVRPTEAEEATITIEDIYVNSPNKDGLIGDSYLFGNNELKHKLIIKNVLIEGNKTSYTTPICASYALNNSSIEVENIKINITVSNASNFVLLYNIPTNSSSRANIEVLVKNVDIYIKSSKTISFAINNITSELVKTEVDGIIFKGEGLNKLYAYYGSDFSGFYCDWKTGELRLKSLNGKGFYQGEVDENMLKTKGYKKLA